MASNAACTSRLAFGETSPIRNVSDESPCQPSTIVVRSTLTMSPSAQQVVVRDAVTDDLIHAGANRIRVTIVAQAGGGVAMLERVVVSQLIDLACGDAGSNAGAKVVHEFGVESAGGTKGVAFHVRRIDRDFGRRPGLWPQQSTSGRSHKITCWWPGVVKFGSALWSGSKQFATKLK